ncbi:MAG: heme biosynthesis protein HemY [Alphaproteobacteria bacterium]
MIRFLLYLGFIFLLALGFVWLADRPGDLALHWQGYEIRTSLVVAAVGIVVVVAALALLGAIVRMALQAPGNVRRAFGARKRDRGYRALTRGMIAVGAGDTRGARRAAQESRTLLGSDPLVMLLAAQSAQLTGNRTAARTAFERLADNHDTRVLGLHGLFVEAQRQGEHAAALHFAEEAHHLSAQIPWAGQAVFDYRSRAGNWAGALEALTANESAGQVDRLQAARLRAVLLTGKALALESGVPDEARQAALEACKLASDLVPAAVVAARLLTRAGDVRRATRILESAWRTTPHPELATAYADVRSGDSAQDRLKRVQKLAALRPGEDESAIAIAQAAIAAQDWNLARATLAPLLADAPSERVCLLMADVEEGENADIGRVRTWLARALYAPRDPVWTADGKIFNAWAPVSPVSGRVDAFAWRVVAIPLPARRALELAEVDEADRVPPVTAIAARPEAVETVAITESEMPPPAAENAVADEPAGAAAAVEPASQPAAPEEPVLHPPDDPGPGETADDEDAAKIRRI